MRSLHSDFVSLNTLWRTFIGVFKILGRNKRSHCQLLGMLVTVQCASHPKENSRRLTIGCSSSICHCVKL